MKDSWKHGEKSALASRLGISPQYLSNILNGRHTPDAALAERIETESAGRINRLDVLYPAKSSNPLLRRNGK